MNLTAIDLIFGWMNRCKRLNGLGLHSLVLSKASHKMLTVKSSNWSESAHRFLKLCADSGNIEACYTLGMVSIFIFFPSNTVFKIRLDEYAN